MRTKRQSNLASKIVASINRENEGKRLAERQQNYKGEKNANKKN